MQVFLARSQVEPALRIDPQCPPGEGRSTAQAVVMALGIDAVGAGDEQVVAIVANARRLQARSTQQKDFFISVGPRSSAAAWADLPPSYDAQCGHQASAPVAPALAARTSTTAMLFLARIIRRITILDVRHGNLLASKEFQPADCAKMPVVKERFK